MEKKDTAEESNDNCDSNDKCDSNNRELRKWPAASA